MARAPPNIYLNNAATTWPKPPEVLEAVRQSLALPVFGSGRTTGSQGDDYITLAREALAALLNVDPPEHVVFTQNATESLNLLIQGFLAASGDGCHVITTELDHNSVLRPLHELERQGRIRLTVLPFEDGAVRPETVEAAITPDTRLMGDTTVEVRFRKEVMDLTVDFLYLLFTTYREGPMDLRVLKQREQAVNKRVQEHLYGR